MFRTKNRPIVTYLLKPASGFIHLFRLKKNLKITSLLLLLTHFTFGQINWSLPKDVRYQTELAYYYVQRELKNPNLKTSARIELQCNLSGLYHKKGQFGEAEKVLLEIMDLEKAPVKTKIIYYLALANTKKFLKMPTEAVKYYDRVVYLAKKYDQPFLYFEGLIEKAEFFRRYAQFEEGLILLDKTLIQIKKREKEFYDLYAYALGRKADILNETNRNLLSLEESRNSITISNKVGNHYLQAVSYNEMGFSYKNLGAIDSAFVYYNLAEQSFRSGGMLLDAMNVKFNRVEMCAHYNMRLPEVRYELKDMLREIDEKNIHYPKRMIYMYLFLETEKIGKYKEAIQYLVKHHEENDDIFTKEKIIEIENVRQQEQNKRIVQESENIAKELKRKKQELKLKDQKLILYLAGFVGLLSIIVLMLRLYVSKRKLTRDLEDQNKLKDFLIQEVHHRVKNNLNFIQSLLEMQQNTTDIIEEAVALREASLRISSVSLVHEMLYFKDAKNVINLKDYVNDLIQNLFFTFNLDHNFVKIIKEIDDVQLSIQQCTAFGILLTELFTNSAKHSFPQMKTPEFLIQLNQNPDTHEARLLVKDNGPQIDLHLLRNKTDSLGMRLIDIFSRQLKGEYELKWQDGLVYELHFSLNE